MWQRPYVAPKPTILIIWLFTEKVSVAGVGSISVIRWLLEDKQRMEEGNNTTQKPRAVSLHCTGRPTLLMLSPRERLCLHMLWLGRWGPGWDVWDDFHPRE